MSTVRVYRSTDSGAPSHPSATRGSMAALVRACLVTGYGSITVSSFTISSGVGTMTVLAHKLDVGAVIGLSGAEQTNLNRDWKIFSVVDADTVTVDASGVSDVTATGTLTAKHTPAGWEEPFVEQNNYACFRALEGQKLFYQINDAMASDRVTNLSPFDSMSSVTTGIGPHGSCYFGKRSDTVPTTDWVVVADEKTAYVSTSSQYGHILGGFGEYYALRPDHPCKGFVMGHSNSSQNGFTVGFGSSASTNNGLVLTGNPISEGPYTSFIAWVGVCSAGLSQHSVRCINGTYYSHPDASTQNYAVEPAWLISGWNTVGRFLAKLRGVYLPQAFRPKGHKEVFSHGSKTFIALNLGSNNSSTDTQGQGWIDLGPWEEST